MSFNNTVEKLSRVSHHEGMMAVAALRTQPDFAMPPQKASRFPRSARLLRHADFERVYKQGRRHFSATMTVFYWPRPGQEATGEEEKKRASVPVPEGPRVGFTVGRALGGAVQRNRMKRRLREAVRRSLPVAGPEVDIVINPKKSLLAADFTSVLGEVSRAFAVIEQKLSEKAGPLPEAKRIVGRRKPEAGNRS